MLGVDFQITSTQDLRDLPFIGARAVEKIEEILETGHLRSVVNANTEAVRAQRLFARVHGIGAKTAKALVDEGFRSLADLREESVVSGVELSFLSCHGMFSIVAYDG